MKTEDKKNIRNAEDNIEIDELRLDDIDGAAGGRTQVCVKRRTINKDGKPVINTVWVWEDSMKEEDKKNIIARREW